MTQLYVSECAAPGDGTLIQVGATLAITIHQLPASVVSMTTKFAFSGNSYKRVESGSCATHGMEPIMTTTECDAALHESHFAPWPTISVYAIMSPGITLPGGCTLWYTASGWVNIVSSSQATVDPCSVNVPCFCKTTASSQTLTFVTKGMSKTSSVVVSFRDKACSDPTAGYLPVTGRTDSNAWPSSSRGSDGNEADLTSSSYERLHFDQITGRIDAVPRFVSFGGFTYLVIGRTGYASGVDDAGVSLFHVWKYDPGEISYPEAIGTYVGAGGTGATFSVTASPGEEYTFTITASGSGYSSGDRFVIPGTALGGASPENDQA